MKALAASLVCLLALNAPSQAFVHGGGGHAGPAPHPGGAHGDGHGDGRGDGHGGGRNVFFDPFGGQVISSYPDPALATTPTQPVADDEPPILLPPVPFCPSPAAAAAAARPSGPHIIYIGAKPKITGPRVIYGTE